MTGGDGAGGQVGDGQAGREVVVWLNDLERPAQALLWFAFAAADEQDGAVRAVHAWDVPSDVRCDPEP